MKLIIHITLLTILAAGWAFRGNYIADWGYWLNSLTAFPFLGYAFWGILSVAALYLGLYVLHVICNSIRNNNFSNALIFAVFLLLVYFGTDIIEKGHTLNELTPYPLLGWMFWGVLIVFVYWQVLYPIVCFAKLTRLSKQNIYDQAKIALKKLDSTENDDLYSNMLNAMQLQEEDTLKLYLSQYHEKLNQKAEKTIFGYSKVASIAAIVGRSKWVDGIALLYLQLRMVIELAKQYGGKPSPVFCLLCLGWVLTSSFVYLIIQSLIVDNAEGIAEEVVTCLSENFMEDLDMQFNALKDGLSTVPFVNFLSSVTAVLLGPVLEASLAGTNVYLTGKLFLWKLNGETKELTFRKILQERRKGRLKIVKSLLTTLPKKSDFKQAINSGVKTFCKKEEIEEASA